MAAEDHAPDGRPVIGIGAGPSTDGQVLVFHDLLGIREGLGARFVKRYANLQDEMDAGIGAFAADVRSRRYPAPEHDYSIDPEELERFRTAARGLTMSGRRSQGFHLHSAAPWPGWVTGLRSRDREFFDLFEEAGAERRPRGGPPRPDARPFPERSDLARDIVICEQEGDRIAHDIHHRLNSTFVTPIDREDILELTSALDDIIDLIDEVADYLGLYRIEAPMEQAQQMAHILLQATRQIAEAMPGLRDFQDLSHYTVEIDRLENDGDRDGRQAIASLFDDGIDPMVVIRWKDIFERLEEADRCDASTSANIARGHRDQEP